MVAPPLPGDPLKNPGVQAGGHDTVWAAAIDASATTTKNDNERGLRSMAHLDGTRKRTGVESTPTRSSSRQRKRGPRPFRPAGWPALQERPRAPRRALRA